MQNLKITDMLNYKFLYSLSSSEDSETACFISSEMNVAENTYKKQLWQYDAKTRALKCVKDLGSSNQYYWYDNNSVLISKLDESKQISGVFRINLDTGIIEDEFIVPLSVKNIQKLDEERFIITALYDHCEEDDFSENFVDAGMKRARRNEDYYVFDEIPFWHDDRGIINKKRRGLSLFNRKTGENKLISKPLSDVSAVGIRREKVLYQAKTYTEKIEVTSGLYVYDIVSDTTEVIVAEGTYNISNALFMEDDIVFFGTDMKSYGIRQNDCIYIYRVDTHKVELLKDMDVSLKTAITCDCRYKTNNTVKVHKGKVYFTITTGYETELLSIDRNGYLERHMEKSDAIDDYAFINSGILYVGMRDMRLQELYLKEAHDNYKISEFNESTIQNKKIVSPEIFTYKSNAYEIDGFVIKPVEFDAHKQYPGILMIHGGPNTTYGKVFYHDMQCLVNEGYCVFFTNPHGSAGRGNAFGDLRGRYGHVDYEDLMNFTDEVLKRYPWIDSSNLGVIGGSYGGFMTNWIIGHTDRFKCAISEKGISNWIGKFATTDIGITTNVDQQASDPWTDQPKMWAHSPMKYADRVKTPTLFIHSDQDYRCWYLEGLEMFTALMYHNVESKIYLFKGESHAINRSGKPRNRIKRLEVILEWFKNHLKGE
ncbi:alpha/beta hydrolase family protein [Fusibacter ferrireducens]|uniref:S9 family peptidase n=1 Tax=Fusibacter ferrireducens TaxID=2785058 RepID=A0ABR9ZVE1_9FIRM|nr:S9 family peptidase [Fusibacter ferrireducens]MBF4694437.1 S9 family peptidase [Fusibacter ferrireducens]